MANGSVSRRQVIRALALGTVSGTAAATRGAAAIPPAEDEVPADFAALVRSYVAPEAEFVHVGSKLSGVLELDDGSLLGTSAAGRAVSADGGRTWSRPEPTADAAEGAGLRGLEHLLRLKSGAIGAFTRLGSSERGQWGLSPWFTLSRDGGKSWSKPVRVGEPYNNVVMFGATVTSTGRIVVSAYTLLGKNIPERGKAFFRDRVALVGHHGYEYFFTYCYAYYSDDEGKSWRTNEGRGVWAAGGELFVTIDESLGGHYCCEEPVVAEVAPERLLMLLRTPLGRFYQSWSRDNGTSWSRPEPTALASAYAPASLMRVPGTTDLVVVWNQSSTDEIERGWQRHRLSSAVSRDGGATWRHGRNVFSILRQTGDRTYIEPPPARVYRAREQSPRLPPNDVEATYPLVSFWKDRVLVRFSSTERGFYVYDAEGRTGYERRALPAAERARREGEPRPSASAGVCVGLPVSWFYA